MPIENKQSREPASNYPFFQRPAKKFLLGLGAAASFFAVAVVVVGHLVLAAMSDLAVVYPGDGISRFQSALDGTNIVAQKMGRSGDRIRGGKNWLGGYPNQEQRLQIRAENEFVDEEDPDAPNFIRRFYRAVTE